MSEVLELSPQLDVVVELAVETDAHAPIGGPEGLMAAGREVDDGESAVAECDAVVERALAARRSR